MFIVRNFGHPVQMDSEGIRGKLVYTVMTVWMVLPFLVGCAGSGTRTDRVGTTEPQSDVETERLERLLDEQQKKRLKPTEKSPGPIMISLFTREQQGVSVQGVSNGGRNRVRGKRRRGGSNTASNNGTGDYQYLILLSREWAYENRPIQEPFLDYARPGIKIMEDWQLNRFLTFLEENQFKQFPSTKRFSASDIENLSGSEPVLTVWKGNRFRRVHFTDRTRERVDDTAENDLGGSPKINRYSNRLIIGFIRAYNAAGRNRMQVQVGPSKKRKRLEDMIEQAGSEENRELKEKLYKARVLHKNGKHRRAKNVLTRILERSKGTTYAVDVRNLLHAVNEAIQNE